MNSGNALNESEYTVDGPSVETETQDFTIITSNWVVVDDYVLNNSKI